MSIVSSASHRVPVIGGPEIVGLLLPGRLRPREGNLPQITQQAGRANGTETRTQVLLTTPSSSPESDHKKRPLETRTRSAGGRLLSWQSKPNLDCSLNSSPCKLNHGVGQAVLRTSLGTHSSRSGHPSTPPHLIKSPAIHPPQSLPVWVGLGTEAKGRERPLGAQHFSYILHINPERPSIIPTPILQRGKLRPREEK